MAIGCVYCDGEHDTAAEVRACWQSNGEPITTTDRAEPSDLINEDHSASPIPQPFPARAVAHPEAIPVAPRAPSPRVEPAVTVAEASITGIGPGPNALARNLVVGPGGQPSGPWKTADRVVINARALQDPGPTGERLRAAAVERRRLVLELEVPFEAKPTPVLEADPHSLSPSFSFALEELHHLVWSNSVDGRVVDRPRWFLVDQAVRAGARPVTDGSADIVLPSGDPAWIDGGPILHLDPIDGVSVLAAMSVEHRHLVTPGPNTTTADLAADQLAAVSHAGGTARIIAPAGSGKTRVLTERARHLLTSWQLPPSAVSLVAFNKRAQEEMTVRTADLPQLQVRTLNAIGLAIVNGTPPFAPQPRRWNTINEPEVRRIISTLVSFPRRRNADPVAPWIEAFGVVRLGLADPAEVEARYGGDVDGLAEVWPRYREALERAGAVDFDDQIYRALHVLLTQPEARAAAQRASRMLLVDEFQDLTPAHILLIRLLSSPGGAVFGVGDDDQTIYGYNGADPGWLIDFGTLFGGAGSHPLEVNYRCPPDIVEAVDRLLRHNTRRVPKTIRSATDRPGGHAVGAGWSIDGTIDPVAATVGVVQTALSDGAKSSEIAVLTRVNAVLAPVQVGLTQAGIPVAGGVGTEFSTRTAVRSALAWLRLATSGGSRRFDPDDVREALRRPSRSFHPRIADWIAEQDSIVSLRRLSERLNNDKDATRLEEFATDIETLQRAASRGSTTADLVDHLIEGIGLAGAVSTLDKHRRGMNRAAQGDDLVAVRQLAALHDEPGTFARWLGEQLGVTRSPGGVVLSTVHRVKGQEWPNVIVHFADAEQYPHRLAEDVEEERRLFHVAITRASGRATIVTGGRPSPFVAELTSEPSASATVGLHRPQEAAASRQPTKSATADPQAGLDAAARARYDMLTELRNELRDGKPAYVVFDNKTAVAIARVAPANLAQLSGIPGIGPAKLERYGEAILETIRRSESGQLGDG